MVGYLSKPLSAGTLFGAISEFTVEGRRKHPPRDGMPVLDQSAIDTPRGFMTVNQIEVLLTESLADIERRVRHLGVQPGPGANGGAANEAHDLISATGNCGARTMSALASDIERACGQGVLTDAIESFARRLDVAPGAIGALTTLRDGMMKTILV
jgi:HPt (histidine-containing phosphotransfer) domain-containing protein